MNYNAVTIPHPTCPPVDGTVLLTRHGHLHHQNVMPKSGAATALKCAERILSTFQDPRRLLSVILTMLYDVPVEPLIAARPEAKGSLLGLLSLAFLAHHQETCAQVRRIMESGTGAMVIDLSGGPGAPSASWQLFDDRSAYEEFLPTLMLVRADSSMP